MNDQSFDMRRNIERNPSDVRTDKDRHLAVVGVLPLISETHCLDGILKPLFSRDEDVRPLSKGLGRKISLSAAVAVCLIGVRTEVVKLTFPKQPRGWFTLEL